MGDKTRYNHEQLEKLVLNHLTLTYPEFKLKDAMLEVSAGVGDEIRSWWISCEHQDGNVSIIEDEEIIRLIQQQKGWSKITSQRVAMSDRAEFTLELSGK